MTNDNLPKSFSVIFLQLMMNHSIEFNKEFLDKNKITSFITLPLTNEDIQGADNPDFIKLLNDAIE